LTSPRTIVVPDNYPTIQAAINTADNGDAIFVRNGTYLENVVVNKTLYLIGEDRDNTIIDAERVGSPLTVIANNVSVEGLTLTNAAAGYGNAGIVLDANFCQVSNNMISNCLDRGILVPDNQSHDSFTNDIMTNNTFWGIELHIGDKNNFIAYNNIYENGWGIGVCGGSDNNAIVGNTVENVSRYGIYLSSTSNNVVVGNTVENVQSDESIGMEGEIVNNVLSENTVANCAIGLSIENPSGTILFHIFHNNLINNTIQASVGGTFVNMFDNGYPSGGNYWSDYNGSDVFGGPYQNLTGSDGIGDTPYFIDTCNLDNYPLMNPWSPHDIVVANTVLSKTVVGQGYLDVLSVTVMNAGAFAENFNVTSDAFNLLSGVQSVGGIESVSNLLFNETRFVALGWNTAGLAYGNYTLSVCASPVVGQTNVVNNNCIGGNAVVTIPGDLNGDFKVSLSDLNMLAKAYGSHCANHDYQGELLQTGIRMQTSTAAAGSASQI
jgi:parallel beta-helix repeat protein